MNHCHTRKTFSIYWARHLCCHNKYGKNTLLVSAFQRSQANERKLQGLLTVLSNIQCFCCTRTFSCCCIFLSYILFSPIERKKHWWHKVFFMLHCILMNMQKNQRCNEFSYSLSETTWSLLSDSLSDHPAVLFAYCLT